MDETGSFRKWISSHGSVLFIGALGGGAIVLGVVGVSIVSHHAGNEPPPATVWVSHILLHLSSALVVAAAVSAFLSFRDVRENIVASVRHVLSDGRNVVRYLPELARDALERNIILQRIGGQAKDLEPDLTLHFRGLTESHLVLPHYRNTRTFCKWTRHPTSEHLLMQSISYSCVVSFEHLKEPHTFDYMMVDSCLIGAVPDIDDSHYLKSFNATIGESTFGIGDVSITRSLFKGQPVIEMRFAKKIVPTKPQFELKVHYQAALPIDERALFWVSRYPSKGFSARLDIASDLEQSKFQLDGVWFKSGGPWKRESESFHSEGEIAVSAGTIEASTEGWVLAGEGVAITCQP